MRSHAFANGSRVYAIAPTGVRFGGMFDPQSGARLTFVRRLTRERNYMNWDVVAGDWKQLKGKVRQQWGKLTEDNLNLIDGKRDESAGKIQEAYGVTKEEAEKKVKSFVSTNNDYRMKNCRM